MNDNSIKQILEFLDAINARYAMPVRLSSPVEIIDGFNEIVRGSYKDDMAIKCVLPLFFSLEDKNWTLSYSPIPFTIPNYFPQKVLTAAQYEDALTLHDECEKKPRLTKKLLDNANGTDLDVNFVLYSTSQNAGCSDIGCRAFPTNDGLHNVLRFCISEELCRTVRDWNNKFIESSTSSQQFIGNNIHVYEQISVQIDRATEKYWRLINEIAIPLFHHIPYLLEPGYSLYFIFAPAAATFDKAEITKLYSLGGLFVLLKGEQNGRTIFADCPQLEKEFIAKSRGIIGKLSSSLVTYFYRSITMVHATKSAIGSIMSRNGSHNIGSHVLSALSHNVGTMPDDRVLYQYIQHRMDYIATATTDFPSWTYSTPVVSGMMKEFLSQRHLLDYIANSEGLRAYRFQDANMDNAARDGQKNTIRISVSKCIGKNEVVDYITYPYADDNKYRERLSNDVSVAIPGGTIGEHAFFTILENVIRNAAKHGWAVRNKQGAARNQNRNEKVENLDIYIEVLDDVTEYPEDVVVTIWDNISDVFAVSDKERNRKDRMLGLKKLKSWIDKNAKVLQKPLDDDKMSVQQLKDYFAGKVVELPNPYRSLVEVLNNPIDEEKEEGLKVWSVLSEILVGRTENDAELGHRLWLPMHHRQQLKLEEPLIDDTGTLRRENWGLAEMKISAGYLQRREIGEIGGLESDKKEQIITAVAKELNGVYHLGYKFKIPRPKELLLALDDGEQNKKFKDADKDLRKALIEQGVYVKRMSEIKFGEEGLKDLSYKYVLLPYFPVNKGDPYLPFRVLTRDEFWGNPNAPGGCIVPSIGEEEYKGVVDLLFNGCDTPKKRAHAILNKVYHHWIDYLVRKRRRLDVKEYPSYPPLYIQTVDNVKSGTNSGNVSAGRCLISDVDIWKVVFSEMFHSVTMNFLKSRKKYKNEGWFALLFLIASWLPRRQDIVLVKEGIKLNDDDIRNKESQMLATQLLKWYDDGIKEVVESNKNLYTNYGVKDSGAKFGEETGYQWPKDIALNKNAIKAAVEDLKKMTAPTGVFADYFATLRAAFVEADVLLRKYEERIITLPNMFSAPTEAVKGGGDVMEDKAIGEVLHLNLIIDDPDKLANEKEKSVDYRRHFKFDNYNAAKQLYAEPLSGTQSYLNSLFRIKDDSSSSGLVTTLYEAGLMRVLIIDERVADFIRKHDGTAETFAKMNMWVVDDKKLLESNVEGTAFTMPESDMSSVKGLLTFNSRNFATFREKFRATWSEEQKSAALLHEQVRAFVATKGARFDMLIIHQGLIDKWFDGASLSEAKMEKFLEYWRDVVPYVVITTGRGTPANTPKTARILPFSVVENTLYKKYPEKLVLVDTIMNILPKGGRK